MLGNTHSLLIGDFNSSVTDGTVDRPPSPPTNGNDTIIGTTSPETLYGLDGNDFIYGHELHGQDTGGNLNDNDLIYGGNGIDEIRGGLGSDTLYGDSGDDVLYGGNGTRDILYGGDGNDGIVHGDGGDDTCYGGNGDDALRGGKGTDQLYGGDGHDTFEFRLFTDSNASSGIDTIQDFDQENGQDRIELSQLDANCGSRATRPSTLSARTALAHAGDLNAVRSGDYIIVSATVDANSTPELSFRILDTSHLLNLASTDFLL